MGGVFRVEIFDESGFKVRDMSVPNLVVNTGLQWIRDAGLTGDQKASAYYIGLTDASPTIAAGDTMASHSGWAEVTAYSEGARQTWTKTTNGTGSLVTSSVAEFNITSGVTVGGLFLTSSNVKGGTAGTLISVAALTGGNAVLQSGWLIRVTYTLTISSAA